MKGERWVKGGLSALVLWWAAGLVAQADRLILESGDVLTGEYIGREDGRIIFRSVLMGEIRVDGQRGRVERDAAGEMTAEATAWVERVSDEQEAEEPVVEEEAAGAIGVVEAVPAVAGEGGWWAQWDQRIRVGYSWESAEARTDDLSIRYEAGREWAGGTLRVQGRYEYGSSKDGDAGKVVVRDRWSGSLRYRSDFGKQWFVQLDGNYKRDQLQEIAHEIRQNSGVGWRAVDREKWQITFLPQVTVRYLELMREQPGWDLLLSLRQDFRYKWSERVEFRQAAGISWDPGDFHRSNYEWEFRMENRLTERLFLDLAYELEFDYELEMGINSKTQRTVLMVGYEF